ncbi:MAG TPA: S8/S53 family peptidase [Stackebrandtia sp.]|jgi:hypothetical protein|uniref:S8 family peptidase n=1 Tax=Stackebrandtia sp. TaxID=2023065 RepID=UPI002D720A93|nr:S8/S53 family peptidase [Stackebrandtia sp.]HZE40718.1 S8/S53 family peptidase [Stackebrandtia sp.]
MKLYFTGETPRLPESNSRRDRTAGVPNLPDSLLDRHRARVLRPGDAPLAAGSPTPGSTIYRYNRVLMCHRLLGNDEQLAELDAALAVHGMRIDREHLGKVPHDKRMRRARVTLGERATPDTVDAWRVLQTLRGAVSGGRCSQDVLKRLRLEHLLVGSALQGAGAAWVGTERTGSPGSGGPFENGGPAGYTYPSRTPVDMVLPMPSRRPLEALTGKRRPVIAVLDSGVTPAHPAFDISDRQEQRDTFITVDSKLQELLANEADPESPHIEGPWDSMDTDGSLLGEVTSHFGHGTFISGVIRQLAPDAQVRSIRVMQNDGIVYEHECLGALTALADEVERARNGDDSADPVDIVSLSFGYVDEDPDDQVHGALRDAIGRLTSLGVPVIAAAGNFASNRPFYPAAFAAEPQPQQAAPVISVGALNPNETLAMFTNEGPWVSCYATGASLVSTYPTYADGDASPSLANDHGTRYRESLDPDDFTSGYAIWSGTSFAAPIAAAKLASAMIDNSDLADLAPQDAQSVTHRVQSAIKAIGG